MSIYACLLIWRAGLVDPCNPLRNVVPARPAYCYVVHLLPANRDGKVLTYEALCGKRATGRAEVPWYGACINIDKQRTCPKCVTIAEQQGVTP